MMTLESALQKIVETPARTDSAPLARLVKAIRPQRNETLNNAITRVHHLVDMLTRHPEWAEALQTHLVEVLAARYQRFIYSESGILASDGFFSALARRLLGRILPDAPDERFLKDLVSVVFAQNNDYRWLGAIPADTWLRLRALLLPRNDATLRLRNHARQETLEAIRMLSQRLAAIGLEPEVMRYYPELAEHESPFLAQSEETIAFINQAPSSLAENAPLPDSRHLLVLLDQCNAYIGKIRKRSREAGAGVHLTYLLKRIEQIVARIELLISLLSSEDEAQTQQRHTSFLIDLVREENRRYSVQDLVANSLQLLARQVTEHASKTGEHYITESRTEYWQMFRAAAGAGLIVGFMALIKVFIGKLHLPPLWEAIGFSLNYGLGFVLVHLLHFTIATKQPAMTAAALAASLDRARTRAERTEVLTDLAVQVCRTQWIAIVGNVLLGFATSLAIAMTLIHGLHYDPIGEAKAQHMLADLHPWLSWAIPHAAIAGAYLFLAGLISGYYDNKAIYNRIPERIRRVDWLNRLFGQRRAKQLSQYLERNLGALAGNFLFGCMLGCTGTIGFLSGLPLDIRHITFAAANFAYALATPGMIVTWQTVAITSLGVALIGLTNLSVSFWLAMRVALRSRGVQIESRRELIQSLLRRLIAQPRDFLWPPSNQPS